MKKKFKRYIQEIEKAFTEDEQVLSLLTQLKEKVELLPNKEEKAKQDISSMPLEVKDKENHFALFCDGACRGNPGPGSWAMLGMSHTGEKLFEANGLEVLTTNNKMELEGAIVALSEMLEFIKSADLSIHHSHIFLYSDSKYVIEGITKWVVGWKANSWRKADKKEPENLELWQKLDALKDQFMNLQFIWVKGHAGHPQNEHCDQLCNQALDEAGY